MKRVCVMAGVVVVLAGCGSSDGTRKTLKNLGRVSARVGPGPVAEVVSKNGYRLQFHVTPNRAAAPNTFSVRITRDGRPVQLKTVIVSLAMRDMEMGVQSYQLAEVSPGLYEGTTPALVMVGNWGLTFEFTPPRQHPFTVQLFDRATE
jgi:YtkA-like protein